MTLPSSALENLLKLCDQIRDRQARGAANAAAEDAEQTRARLHDLLSRVIAETPSRHRHPLVADLDDAEVLVLALLFHRRVCGRNEPLLGSDLTGLLRQAGFSPSTALSILDARARLRSGGWVHSQRHATGFDPLDSAFMASSEGLSLFWHGGNAAPEADTTATEESNQLAPYRDEEELLWDLHDWRSLCMQRADALFPHDGSATPSDSSPRLDHFQREARGKLLRIRERIALTPGGSEFAIERFRRHNELGSAHLLMVLHLLFGELVEGEPCIPALECLRLIAETRTDLLRQRRVIGPRGKLRRNGIVVTADSGDYGKQFVTELTLADWATDALLGTMARNSQLREGELDELFGDSNGGEEKPD